MAQDTIVGERMPERQNPSETTDFYVGQYMARVVPAQTRMYVAPAAGDVTRLVDAQQRIRKGTVILALNEKDINLERNDLEIGILREKIDKKEEIQKLEKEREELQFLLALPEKQRQYAQKNESVPEISDRILKTFDQKIELAQKELAILEEKKREEFRKKEEGFIIKMPFDGRVQYPFIIKKNEKDETPYVESGKDMVSVCDDSSYFLSINVSNNAEITRIPPECFRLVTELANGETIEADYSHRLIQKGQGGGSPMNPETLVFFFKITSETSESLYNMLGVNFVSKLYFKSDGDIKAFSKMELSSLPEAKNSATWQELLSKIAPDYSLLIVGETQIIAQKK